MQQPPAGFVANREEAAERVREALGGRYSFRDGGALLEEALTHSLSPRNPNHNTYQRLEFIGDSALGLAFSTLFYREYPGLGPGELTALRSANTSNEKLARSAVRHDLYPLLRRHNCEPLDHDVIDFTKSLRRNAPYSGDLVKAPKVLADIVEAIAGAVYVDSEFDLKKLQELKIANVILDGELVGIGSAKQVKAARRNAAQDALNTLMVDQKEKIVEELCSQITVEETMYKNPVSVLNEHCQKHKKHIEYKVSDGVLKVANITVDGELVGTGSAEQKKVAKRNAAQDALGTLMVGQKGQ
uniref:RNase III domain-containing protein n=1 Tax=Leersia perrieri TaxID=77586 RepID=A0A0D9V1X9_9ORYZ